MMQVKYRKYRKNTGKHKKTYLEERNRASVIIARFLIFGQFEPRDSYKKNSIKTKCEHKRQNKRRRWGSPKMWVSLSKECIRRSILKTPLGIGHWPSTSPPGTWHLDFQICMEFEIV